MGYNTDFQGSFTCEPVLTAEQVDTLQKFAGQAHRSTPGTPPGYCQWVPSGNGTGVEWDGGEKFYDYVEWINVLINQFFTPWGVQLNGKVNWRGEEFDDMGTISITNNMVTTKQLTFGTEE